jgi:hypothetical protein
MSGRVRFFGDQAPVPKDVVMAGVGVEATVAGLILVFLGVLVSMYQALPATATDTAKAPYKRYSSFAFGAFLISVASLGLGIAWLAVPGGSGLYHVEIAVLVIQIVALALLAGAVVWDVFF